MIFENTKLIIIDDNPDEFETLIKRFKIDGIGYTHYTGALDDLPAKPLSGVRTLFLDFVLGTDGQPEKTKISVLMGTVKKVISKDNGPFVMITWTKHSDLLSRFKTEVMKDSDFPKPFTIIETDKSGCMKSLYRIKQEFKKKLNDDNVLNLLFSWESIASKSLREVLDKLCSISTPVDNGNKDNLDMYLKEWNDDLTKHINKLAEIHLGKKNMKANAELINTVLLSLNPYYLDCMEKGIIQGKVFSKNLAKIILAQNSGKYDLQKKALMNTTFLINENPVSEGIQPGNIYLYKKVMENVKCNENECLLNKSILTPKKIVTQFFDGDIDKYKNKASLYRLALPVLLEITPSCDYVQGNWQHLGLARMLMGVLWPLDYEKKLKKAPKIYGKLPIMFSDRAYLISFHSHFVYGIPLASFKTITPLMKIRKEFLVDIQHWYSKQISRPGKIEF